MYSAAFLGCVFWLVLPVALLSLLFLDRVRWFASDFWHELDCDNGSLAVVVGLPLLFTGMLVLTMFVEAWQQLPRELAHVRVKRETAELEYLKLVIPQTKARIIQLRDEREKLCGQENKTPVSLGKTLIAQELELRRDYDWLLRRYNWRMNMNYSLLGSSPIAATFHLVSDIPPIL
jgi:hypothetical protein